MKTLQTIAEGIFDVDENNERLTLTGLSRKINRGQLNVPLIKNGSEYYISNQALDF